MQNVTVKTFVRGDRDEIAFKVREEALEFLEEHVRYNASEHAEDLDEADEFMEKLPLMLEIGDVITAICNYCDFVGINAQNCVALVQIKNLARGYYGNQREAVLQWERDAQAETSSAQCGDSL